MQMDYFRFLERQMNMLTNRSHDDIEADEIRVVVDLVSELITEPRKIFEIIEKGLEQRVVDGLSRMNGGSQKPYWVTQAEEDLKLCQLKRKRLRQLEDEREAAKIYKDFQYDRIDEQ